MRSLDIMKCKGRRCPLKNTCFRYRMEAKEKQQWLKRPRYIRGLDGVRCDFHWELPKTGGGIRGAGVDCDNNFNRYGE